MNLYALTDQQLENAIGNALADWALAQKYEHNAHLRPAIQAHLDRLTGEKERRMMSERVDEDRGTA